MIELNSDKILTDELLEGAIENNEHPGFREDYLVLHALLKMYQPKTFFEIGCNCGTGTKIIKNALGEDAQVFSLDLPREQIHPSLKHPTDSEKDLVGSYCNLPFTLLRGDSMVFDFYKYPCEGYFVDGEHSTKAVHHETKEILKLNPKIIIYHDANMTEVMQGIINGWNDEDNGWNYELFRISDTRIAYLLIKDL